MAMATTIATATATETTTTTTTDALQCEEARHMLGTWHNARPAADCVRVLFSRIVFEIQHLSHLWAS